MTRISVMVFASLCAGIAQADDWDAKRVLELATEFEMTIEQALKEAQTAPAQETTWQQRTRDAAVLEMRHVHDASRELVQKLRMGTGRDETEPLFSQLRLMHKHAVKTAREAVPQVAVAPLLEKAESLILALQKLYARD